MKHAYAQFRFQARTRELVDRIASMRHDHALSVRQIYYQLVKHDALANTNASYKSVVIACTQGRMAGLIDWNAIDDHGRDIVARSRWTSGWAIVESCVESFHMDMWANQPVRVIVAVEKTTLAGVVGEVCARWDAPLLTTRGYPSVSTLRELATQHVIPALRGGQDVLLLHLADHDPPGLDMTRDLRERLWGFTGLALCRVERVALTIEQVREFKLPTNPVKVKYSRSQEYRREYGNDSWELDALDPATLAKLLTDRIKPCIDQKAWAATEIQIQQAREQLKQLRQIGKIPC